METLEHKAAGDQIRIETLNNPYFSGSIGLSPVDTNKLQITIMHELDNVPMPLDLQMSAGDVVAMAGDYYTKAGWGKQLQTPTPTGNAIEENRQLFNMPVTDVEEKAFAEAYADLASPSVKQSDIERIYSIEKSSFLPSLLQQLVYTFIVKEYGSKLYNNQAHFDPWSMRAYLTGHHSAMQMAELARTCKELASGKLVIGEAGIQLQTVMETINKNPEKYGFTSNNPTDIYRELGHRYHAMAVARDLFAMHFYSDHFAGGHMSRIGTLRQTMPKEFGTLGSILINNMHNEDNTDSVRCANQYQSKNPGNVFQMPREEFRAFGDNTYFQKENDDNSNMLVNGMDNSLGDITRLINDSERPSMENYGGVACLPEIDHTKRQSQPLLLQDSHGNVYVRSDVKNIKVLSPTDYQNTVKNPEQNGYERLSMFKAFVLVIKLRVFGWIFSPKLEKLTAERELEIARDEKSAQIIQSKLELQSELATKKESIVDTTPHPDPEKWRKNPTSHSLSRDGLMGMRTYAASINNIQENFDKEVVSMVPGQP